MVGSKNYTSYPLSYARFRFTIEAAEDAALPTYLGSTLRGAMGHALRQLVCKLPGGDCQKCPHRWQCAFVYIMATSRQDIDHEGKVRIHSLSHPYVIEPPEKTVNRYARGEDLIFNLLLIGDGIPLLPLFIAAFMRAGKNGLGRNRHQFKLRQVEQEYEDQTLLLWQGGNNLLQAPLPIEIGVQLYPVEAKRISLTLHTPVRLVDKGRLDDSPDFSVFMRAVLRRLDSLAKTHGKNGMGLDFRSYIEKAKLIELAEKDCSWLDWERYSSRQSSYMKLGGLVGTLSYVGDLGEFIPYLKMAEILHVGKNSSFGLGRYSMVIND